VDFSTYICDISVDTVDTVDEYDPKNGVDGLHDFMEMLSNVLTEYELDFHKVVVLVETSEIANFLSKAFMMSHIPESMEYHPLLMSMTAYTVDNFDEFSNLNNCFANRVFIGKTKTNPLESGILFVTMDDLVYTMSSPIQLRYTDVMIMFNRNGLDEDTKYTVNSIVNVNGTIDDCMPKFVFVDIYRKQLGKQLSDLYEAFYHTNTMDEETEIRNLIESGTKSEVSALKKSFKLDAYTELNTLMAEGIIHSEMKLTDKKRVKLESIYSIKRADQDYVNRHKIMYITTLTKSVLSMSTTHMYSLEHQYMYLPSAKTGKIKGFINNKAYLARVKDRTEELRMEVNQIVNAANNKVRLKNYSGPLWLGLDNGSESEGSMVAFANEDKNTIEYSLILGTYKFTRTYKRDGWTEKENRDKKILFLSPVFKRDTLSEFKINMKKPQYKRFSQMEKIVID
jgi:hypothetical protein